MYTLSFSASSSQLWDELIRVKNNLFVMFMNLAKYSILVKRYIL